MWLRSLQKAQKGKVWCQLIRQATIQASVTKVSNVTELRVALSPTKAQVQSLRFYLSSQELGRCLGTVALSYPSICSDGFIPSFMETHPEPENRLYFRPPKSWLSGPSPTGPHTQVKPTWSLSVVALISSYPSPRLLLRPEVDAGARQTKPEGRGRKTELQGTAPAGRRESQGRRVMAKPPWPSQPSTWNRRWAAG